MSKLKLHQVLDFQSLNERGRAIFRERGVFPISFSNPRPLLTKAGPRLRFLSEVIPGEPYSFTDEESYLQQYRESHFALSTKKAGWDCFRHLEIAFAGSIPLVPNLGRTPPGIMFAYPKRTWSTILEELSSAGPQVPSDELQRELDRYSEENLSSSAMAGYLLDVLDYQGGPVAFVDDKIDAWVDYQSMFTMIGLAQLLGSTLALPNIPDYLKNGNKEWKNLYGRGFGYSGALEGFAPSSDEVVTSANIVDRFDSFELVIFGQFFRDFPSSQLTRKGAWDTKKLVGILGDDYPVTRGTLQRLSGSGSRFFVRELR